MTNVKKQRTSSSVILYQQFILFVFLQSNYHNLKIISYILFSLISSMRLQALIIYFIHPFSIYSLSNNYVPSVILSAMAKNKQ